MKGDGADADDDDDADADADVSSSIFFCFSFFCFVVVLFFLWGEERGGRSWGKVQTGRVLLEDIQLGLQFFRLS